MKNIYLKMIKTAIVGSIIASALIGTQAQANPIVVNIARMIIVDIAFTMAADAYDNYTLTEDVGPIIMEPAKTEVEYSVENAITAIKELI